MQNRNLTSRVFPRVLLLGLCFSPFVVSAKLLSREKKLKSEYWHSFFYSAQSREEFEEIGKRRQEWLSLLKTTPEECQKFFSILENHQYKKVVQDFELQEIKQALNGMKDVLQRFGI